MAPPPAGWRRRNAHGCGNRRAAAIGKRAACRVCGRAQTTPVHRPRASAPRLRLSRTGTRRNRPRCIHAQSRYPRARRRATGCPLVRTSRTPVRLRSRCDAARTPDRRLRSYAEPLAELPCCADRACRRIARVGQRRAIDLDRFVGERLPFTDPAGEHIAVGRLFEREAHEFGGPAPMALRIEQVRISSAVYPSMVRNAGLPARNKPPASESAMPTGECS